MDRGCTKHVPINGAARPDSVHNEDRQSLCQEFTMKINAAIVLQLHSEDRHYHHQQGTTTINPVTHVVCWLRMADMCSNQITIENPKETLQRKERSLNQTVRNGCLLMRHKASFLKDKAHQHTDTYTRLTALLLHQHTDIYIRQCLYFSCTNTLTLTPD